MRIVPKKKTERHPQTEDGIPEHPETQTAPPDSTERERKSRPPTTKRPDTPDKGTRRGDTDGTLGRKTQKGKKKQQHNAPKKKGPGGP